jgi:hypothetical protein
MSVLKASLWRAALVLVAVALFGMPSSVQADPLKGLSLRLGFFRPQRDGIRDITDYAAFGGGLQYEVPFIPKAFTGENWSTSLSVDFHYSERKTGVFRNIPVAINQVYTFDQANGVRPFAGFCITAATFGTTGTAVKQPTITRIGAGLILGVNLNEKMYLEGRYEWFGKHGSVIGTPEGMRLYFGYRL